MTAADPQQAHTHVRRDDGADGCALCGLPLMTAVHTGKPGPQHKEKYEWGVLQKLVIEADTETALRAACQLGFTEHSHGAASYDVKDGVLRLLWSDTEGVKLPFKLTTPEAVYEFVFRWLAQAEYGEEPDTDGDTKKGFCAESDYGYVFMKFTPTWIIYGK